MRRIRIALLLLSLAILLPVALLAWRALGGLAYERAARHQVVAERAFEEMERALSEFLAREEARPVAHYRFYLTPGGERSPLAGPADEPFVVGAFEIDADGEIRTPLEPDDVETARARGDWPLPPESQQAIAEILAALGSGFPDRRALGARGADPDRRDVEAAEAPASPPAQAPGTTAPLKDAFAGGEALAKLEAAKPDAALEEDATAYDVLQSFNRSARERAERKQKVEEQALPELKLSRLRALGYVTSGAASADREEAPPAPQAQPESASAEVARESEMRDAPRRIRVAIDPMQGRPAGDAHLLLLRTVQADGRTWRQGLVLERAALATWLEALFGSELAQRARVSFQAADAPLAAPGDAFVFRHRFAEPFDALAAQLELAPLPGVGRPGTIYALVGLLLLVGAGGVLALHRMVAVVVGFAERRSNFVAAVTHELKTPLTAIRMYAEMLRDGLVPSDAKRDEYYRTITDESERLSRLIDNVLEFARLERGRRELHLRAGDVAPVLEEALAKLRSHAARQRFELELAADPALPPVQFDRDALLQVLFNLVDNAMKYARASGVRRVRIEARRAGDGVEVDVRDYGPGVAPKHLARIFEPFYRGEDELVRSTQGTGIGLALVRELCARMGASVIGANAEGGGFRVSLGFRPAPAA